jgi:ArsR family transcriptional regulator, arsenate/arsenite/antimonite-responsive transcriptional repressor
MAVLLPRGGDFLASLIDPLKAGIGGAIPSRRGASNRRTLQLGIPPNMSIVIDIFGHVHYDGHMDFDQALIAISAISQETRLKVFKTLVEYGRTGTPAGTISQRLGIPHNTLSFHLAHLSHVKLVSSRKEGRQVIYSANCDVIEQLMGFLSENCCIREKDACTTGCAATCSPKDKKGKKP